MIYKGCCLELADNSGARLGKCILILRNYKYGKIGDLIMVILRKFFNLKKKRKKNSIFRNYSLHNILIFAFKWVSLSFW